MCGRFSHRLRYNVCPTDTISAVVEREGLRELVPMRWGLVPYWWKDKANKTPATFNARAETVQEKPFFRAAFRRTRCLIPIPGYFEWKTTPGGKQPYYFSRVDGAPITVAGLWDEWKDIETRARAGFPIAAPVTWEHVEKGGAPNAFTLDRPTPRSKAR